MNEILKQKIEKMIRSSSVFLFMKGTPEEPQCGFSLQVVEILNQLKGGALAIDKKKEFVDLLRS